MINAHHERWDGTGYGSGLRGEAIPIGAQIIAIADMIDALGSDRSYRQALPQTQIITHLHAERGRAFLPDLLDQALDVLGY